MSKIELKADAKKPATTNKREPWISTITHVVGTR